MLVPENYMELLWQALANVANAALPPVLVGIGIAIALVIAISILENFRW